MEKKRGSFTDKLGFVLAAAGSAVGLGNLWRFPYLAAKHGGGIFLLIYLILAVTFGFALMITEIALGRKTRLSAVGAYSALDKRFLYDLHVAGGIYAAVLVLAMALTGLTWSFGWYRTTVYKLFGAESKPAQTQQQQRGKGGGDYVIAEIAYEDIIAEYERYNDATVTPNSVSVKLAGMGNPRAADKYTLNAEGDIVAVEMYDDAPRRQKVSGWIYAIHVGNFGGYLTRILWFLAAMLGASLPLTGYYLWFKRRFNKK